MSYLPEQARLFNTQASTQFIRVFRAAMNTEPPRVTLKTAILLLVPIQVEAKAGTEVARSGRIINVLHTEGTEPLC